MRFNFCFMPSPSGDETAITKELLKSQTGSLVCFILQLLHLHMPSGFEKRVGSKLG